MHLYKLLNARVALKACNRHYSAKHQYSSLNCYKRKVVHNQYTKLIIENIFPLFYKSNTLLICNILFNDCTVLDSVKVLWFHIRYWNYKFTLSKSKNFPKSIYTYAHNMCHRINFCRYLKIKYRLDVKKQNKLFNSWTPLDSMFPFFYMKLVGLNARLSLFIRNYSYHQSDRPPIPFVAPTPSKLDYLFNFC